MAFGRSYDEFEVGDIYQHWPGKTVTEYDHHLFSMLTMVRHPLHLDSHYAETATRYKEPLVIGTYIFSLLCGLSEQDVAGMAITHKGFEKIEHYAPVRHGDTIYGESEVFAKEPIEGRPERGLVEVETRGRNQHGTLIMSFTRKLVVPTTPYVPSPFPDAMNSAAE